MGEPDNTPGKQGSDVPAAGDSGNVPGEVAPETLRPNMDADSNLPREGQSGDGHIPVEECDTKTGARVPQSLVDRYEQAAYELSEPGDRVSRSDLYRRALLLYIEELEDELHGDDDDDDGGGEIVTRGFSDGGDS
jgi:hypothetical protein